MKVFPDDTIFFIGDVGFDGTDATGRPYDVLGRKPLGQKLTDLVERTDQPLVIALDGGWGSGKSHFLKLWTGAHRLELGGTAEVIYFDAFEHDYLDDPLVSLISRLTSEKPKKPWTQKAVEKVKKAAMPLVRGGMRIGVAAASAGISEVVGPVTDAAVGKIGDTAEMSVDQFWKAEAGRIAAMQAFRDALAGLTKPTKADEPARKIVFIVDELDRCRPDYALTLLEIIKHFFAVPNVHFVLGANLSALENSVKARYGAEINATEYLTKFIHLRMSFPRNRGHQGSGAWAAYFDAQSQAMKLGPQSAQSLRSSLQIYGRRTQISLRDVQRLLTRIALFPKEFESWAEAYRSLGTSALVLLVLAPTSYDLMRQNIMMIEEIEELFPAESANPRSTPPSQFLHHLWRSVILSNPGEETRKVAEGAFGVSLAQLDRDHFDGLWAEIFDTFHLPSQA